MECEAVDMEDDTRQQAERWSHLLRGEIQEAQQTFQERSWV